MTEVSFSIPLIGPRDAFEAIFAAMEKPMIELGTKVKDRVTGFEGTVVARTDWLYTGTSFGVQGESFGTDGTPSDVQWFDEQRLEATE